MGCDPDDKIITDLSSMKGCIAKHLVRSQFNLTDQNKVIYEKTQKFNVENHLISK